MALKSRHSSLFELVDPPRSLLVVAGASGDVVVAQAMNAYSAPATLSREAQAIKRPVDVGPV